MGLTCVLKSNAKSGSPLTWSMGDKANVIMSDQRVGKVSEQELGSIMVKSVKNDFRMLYIGQFGWVTIAVLLFVGNAMAEEKAKYSVLIKSSLHALVTSVQRGSGACAGFTKNE